MPTGGMFMWVAFPLYLSITGDADLEFFLSSWFCWAAMPKFLKKLLSLSGRIGSFMENLCYRFIIAQFVCKR